MRIKAKDMNGRSVKLTRVLSIGAICALGFAAAAAWAGENCVSANVGGGCAAAPGASMSFPLSTDGTDPRAWNPKQEARIVAPESHKIIFENQNIRVIWITVRAGAQEPLHHHVLPAIVVIEPTVLPVNLVQRDSSGKPVDFGFVDALPTPWVGVQPPQAAHSIKNSGPSDAHLIRIEFKKGNPKLLHPEWTADKMPISTDGTDPKTWDPRKEALTAAPENHKLIFENDTLRVQSVTVPPLSEEPYHFHPSPSLLVVDQSPSQLIDRSPTGEAFDLSAFSTLEPYAFVQPPRSIHSVKNLTTTPNHLIRIEFKRGLPK